MKQFVQAIKAALKKADKNVLEQWSTKPEISEFSAVSVERHFSAQQVMASIQAFNDVHHWRQDSLHPCFAQFLGLSQHIDVLSHKYSPFPLMGLVHIENTINQVSPLSPDKMHIRCYFGAIRPHRWGIAVDVMMDVRQGGSTCQTITSTYLYRQASDVPVNQHANGSDTTAQAVTIAQPQSSPVSFCASAGRRYARISGDYNPIHLYSWSAKLFGFKQAIAHGTHVLARCVSVMILSTPFSNDKFTITNEFKYPVPLPCDLTLKHSLQNEETSKSISFELCNPEATRRKQRVLCGRISN